MKKAFFSLYILLSSILGWAQQSNLPSYGFLQMQRSFTRFNDMYLKQEDTLQKQFAEKKLTWPAPFIYLRSFKYDSQLEVWVKYTQKEPYRLFKTYKVCALSGSLGPKRMEGDYQVPEGFYYINEFNPKSQYHFSLGLNYPNNSDRVFADEQRPGGEIYIHGSCVTVGCIPITDEQIEELYVLAAHAKETGQDYIPVHIFPIQFNNFKSYEYLTKFQKDFPEYIPLQQTLKKVYYHFNKFHTLPIYLLNDKGQYWVNSDVDTKELDAEREKEILLAQKPKKVELPRYQRNFKDGEIQSVVDRLPAFPGGAEQFRSFLGSLTAKLQGYLGDGQDKAYLLIEYVIDEKGRACNANVIRGGNSSLNEQAVSAFEQMPTWNPAHRADQPVPVRMKQSLFIERAK